MTLTIQKVERVLGAPNVRAGGLDGPHATVFNGASIEAYRPNIVGANRVVLTWPWAPRLTAQLKTIPTLRAVNS